MQDLPPWAKGAVAIIGALSTAIVAVIIALTVGGSTETIRETVQAPPVLDGVHVDADQKKEPAEQLESGATPAPTDGSPLSSPNLANAGPDIHEDSVDETPPGITRDEADDALVTPPNPLPAGEEYQPQPQGGANDFRCVENYVRNYSSRATGVRVSMFVLHFTVSSPGSLRAIWNLFNTPSFGASSTYLLELNGECEQIVPFSGKPWTQGAFNSASESVEIVTNNLTRNEWLASPIVRDAKLAKIIVSRLKARGLPARLVDPSGCTPQAGVTDHDRLECGNNHWDVGPNFPWGEVMRDVTQIYKHGTLCGKRCQARNRQRKVVAARKKRHEATHAAYQRARCRGRMHKTRLRRLRRAECKEIKRRGHRQHLGITRAKRTLRAI